MKMVDYKEAVRYIAPNHTAAEVRTHHLRRVIPWRAHKTGTRHLQDRHPKEQKLERRNSGAFQW